MAPRFSYLAHLECSRCGREVAADRPQNLCPACQGPLLARYDLKRLQSRLAPGGLARRGRALGMWRYHELLPVQSAEAVVSLGEGLTPLLPVPRLGRELGLGNLLIKDEGRNPTGTFKARGAAAGVARARELGVRRAAMPTAGNAGAAWAAYGARAGVEVLAAMAGDAPAAAQAEARIFGARVEVVPGSIADAARVVAGAVAGAGAGAVAAGGYFDASTLKEPYRIEGKKTMGLELAEDLGWRAPDVVIYPCGGGVGIIGIFKAFVELCELGWLDGAGAAMPRLVAVQAAGCAPIVRAFEEGAAASRPWDDPRTIAAGLRVPKALGDFLVLDAVRASRGTAIAVTDDDILDALRHTALAEGLLLCPEGAAAVAALRPLLARGDIDPGERVVVLNTGSGLKYPEALRAAAQAAQPARAAGRTPAST